MRCAAFARKIARRCINNASKGTMDDRKSIDDDDGKSIDDSRKGIDDDDGKRFDDASAE